MLRRDGVMADLDADAGATLGRKIRRAQLSHYNFQLGKGERGTPRLLVNPSPPRPCVPPPPRHGSGSTESVVPGCLPTSASASRRELGFVG